MSRREYEVGYGKPPVDHRFKPGQSGNPRGGRRRKIGGASLRADFARELDRVLTITENGKKVRITVRQLLIKNNVKLAIQGKASALRFVDKLFGELDSKEPDQAPVEFRMTSEGQKLIELIEQDIRDVDAERRLSETEHRKENDEPPSDW